MQRLKRLVLKFRIGEFHMNEEEKIFISVVKTRDLKS